MAHKTDRLFGCIRDGNMEGFYSVLMYPFDVNANDKYQRTALMLCGVYNRTLFAESLLSKGATADLVTTNSDNERMDALAYACKYGQYEMIHLLLSHDYKKPFKREYYEKLLDSYIESQNWRVMETKYDIQNCSGII